MITLGIVAAVVIGGISYKYIENNVIVASALGSEDATDSKDKDKVEDIKQEVKIDENAIMPGENIIYKAQSYAVPANRVRDMVEGKVKDDKKQVFLTFDDGPSKYTPEILKILQEEGVHATFFVLGSQLKDSKEHQQYLKDEIAQGNAIANHTYTHDFKKLYPHNSVNVNSFMSELDQTNKLMQSILGADFDTNVMRMPGGYMSRKFYKDSNLGSFDNALASEKIVSIDWNGENGDATGKRYSPDQLVQNAIRESKDLNHVILLMHDSATKASTVAALRDLINYYKSNGYEFKVISNDVGSDNTVGQAPVQNTQVTENTAVK